MSPNSSRIRHVEGPRVAGKCRIDQIGLDVREAMVIENMLRMDPELGRRFVFGPLSSDDVMSLVFINGDSDTALEQWAVLSRKFPGAEAVVATSGVRDFGTLRTIQKPLSFRSVAAFLGSISPPASPSAVDSPLPVAKTPKVDDQLRILVVDDSLQARQFLKLKLEELAGAAIRVTVDFADSGEKALQCVHDNTYDIVFLDVVMPGMDGFDVCARIKSSSSARVVMLTGKTSIDDYKHGRSVGCDNYFTKPPNDIDMLSILRLTSLKKLGAGGMGR